MNNFKKLQEEQEEKYKDNLTGIKNSLQSNLGVISTFTDLFDMYISKFVKCLLSSVSGEKTNKENN